MASSGAIIARKHKSGSTRPTTNATGNSNITTFTQKDNYVGEKSQEVRNGFGVYNYDNSFFRYEGEWQNGKKHGHGKLIMKDGSYYEGQFEEGEINGSGYKYWSGTGSEFAGQFYRGELHGEGELKYGDGAFYSGDWCRNAREGRGYLRDPEGQVYEGDFYQHKKNGQGRMNYKNGDVYEGDWVRDKRQGGGVLQMADGSVYEGQFANDLFNGQGKFSHCSGIIYEGQWINGDPQEEATKLVIVGIGEEDSPDSDVSLELLQGERFSISVECQTDDNNLMHLEDGRLLKVSAGFRHQIPQEGSSLLDIIEDIEETPVDCPFGYKIVSYPLTDALVQIVMEDDIVGPEDMDDQEEQSGAVDEPPVPGTEPSPAAVEENTPDQDQESDSEVLLAAADQMEDPVREETPPPPAVTPQRTVEGVAAWDHLLLTKEPPLYRPFAVIDEEADMSKETPAKGKGQRNKKAAKSEAREKEEEAKNRYKRLGDERFSRPGEYVIMVEDVTEPPFLNRRLAPAFLKVHITAPKKEKREKVPKEKEKKKQWNTSVTMAHAVARGSVQLAEEEVGSLRQKYGTLAPAEQDPHLILTSSNSSPNIIL